MAVDVLPSTTRYIPFEAIAPDINGDGTINSRDIVTLRRYLAGGYEDEITVVEELDDVNGDGKRNTRDVVELRKLIVE